MITDNTKKSPGTKAPLMTFEQWESQFGSQYANLSQQDRLQKYQEWLTNQQGSQQQTPAVTTPQFTDNTGSQPTELQQNKPASNIDMMGITNTLTQFGVATGNSDMAKIGMLGSTALKVVDQVKSLKGLQGQAKTAGIAGIAGGAADTLDNMLFGNQRASNSDLTNGMNDMYDFASTAAMTFGGPVGGIIGGAMKVGGLLSDGLTALGVGTDQMTTTDKILDSKFLKLTPVGLINALGASTSDRFSVDNTVREQIGGSYGGAYAFMDDAASRAGKKYGLFSGGSRRAANRDIAKSKVMQSKITDINKEARDRQSIATNTSDLLATNYMFNLSGGYDQRYMRAARMGAKIERIKKINLTFKSGGRLHNTINLDTKEVEWKPVIIEDEVPEFKNGGSIEWQYDNWEPTIIEDEWEPTIVDFFEEGGKTEESKEEPLSNQQNVIPEGALHARKHHMENSEGLTQKGIPVIDDKGEQQAEIELNEIIFNLEVTQKLEELCKDGSDEAAIEAGKLLVQEILFNTEDRTGLIKTLKQGGTINGSTE